MKKTFKIVIFGVGSFYTTRKSLFDGVVAYIDNSVAEGCEKKLDGHTIYNPNCILKLKFDYVVLACMDADAMRSQMIDYGVTLSKILFFEDYLNIVFGKNVVNTISLRTNTTKKCLLCMTPHFDNGGAAAAIINAMKLLSNDYQVDVICSMTNSETTAQLTTWGIKTIEMPAIYTAGYYDIPELDKYEFVICNTVFLLPVYREIHKTKKSFLWLHDPYICVKHVFDRIKIMKLDINGLENIYAVSNLAKDIFCKVASKDINVGILPYCISDHRCVHEKTGKIVFALVGMVYSLKGQDIYIRAISSLSQDIMSQCEFWIVGRYAQESKYYKELTNMAKKYSNIIFLGELTKKDMDNLYSKIDVVVSASRSDMLPTVIAEGMMNQLVVVTSDATGMADYIEDGYNGFVFQSENVRMLTEKMEYIVQNFSQLDHVKENARKTYEKFFTNSQFKKNLEDIMQSYYR